jgi:hypothetical protein
MLNYGYEFSASSVGQTTYDMLAAKGLSSKQNWALKRKYDEVGEIMRACFEKTQGDSQSASIPE